MGLHLITGPATAGKTRVLVEDALKRAAQDGLPVILVPAEPDVRRTQDLLGREGLLGVKVAQFDRWFDELWRAQGDGRTLVTPVVRSALMSQAANEAEWAQQPQRWTSGMTAVLGEVAERIDRSSLPPKHGAEPWIHHVLEQYWELLESNNLVERSEASTLAGARGFVVPGPIAVNHFTDLTWSQEELLLGLARSASVGIALTWVDGRAATRALDPLVARLLSSGADHTTVQGDRWSHPDLQRLGDSLFEAATPVGSSEALELVEVSGARGEMSAVAERVAQLLDSGLATSEIAVVARDMSRRAHGLGNALGARGVRASIDVALPLLSTPYGRALRGLLVAVLDPEATREHALAYVLSPFSGIDSDTALAIDIKLRGSRARGPALLAHGLPAVLAESVNLVRRIARAEGEEAAGLWHLLCSQLLARGLTRDGSEQAFQHAAAHRALMATVGELSGASQPLDPMSVVAAVGGVVVAGAPREGDAVLVTEAHRLKGRRFKVVVIMGLNADEFAPQRDLRLSDEIANELSGQPCVDAQSTERMLFYTLFTRASERLILSRQAVGEAHEPLTPSVFWDEVVGLVGEEACTTERVPAVLSLPSAAHGRLQERLAARRPGSAEARFVLSDRALSDLRCLLEGRELSPSQFERYFSCPYRWYLDLSLRPQEMDPSVGAREAGSISHALLKVFYDRWNALGHTRVAPALLERALGTLSEVERELLPRWEERAVGLSEELAVSSARARAQAVVTDDADITPGFNPCAHEMAFGKDAGQEFVFGAVSMAGRVDRVDVGPGGVLAIDYKSSSDISGAQQFATKGLLQPIVYAAAASALLGAPIAGGVYRSLRSLKVRGFWLDGCVDLGGRGAGKDGMDAEGIKALVEEAQVRVGSAYESMKAGAIEPRASSGCKHCPYSPICGGGAK